MLLYYSPEDFDLSPVAEIDYSDGDYQFDLRVVWRHSSGRLLTARDAGCSCPSPFEEFSTVEELETLDLAALKDEVKSESRNGYYRHEPRVYSDFLRAVESAVKEG